VLLEAGTAERSSGAIEDVARPSAHSKPHKRVTDRLGARRPEGPGRAFSIARKLGAAIVVLLLTVVAVLGIEVLDIERESQAVRRQVALAVSADGPSQLLTSLQDEQGWAAVELIGQTEGTDLVVEGYDATRRGTDDALAGFQALLADSPAETRRAYEPAMDGLAAELESIREDIDSNSAPPTLDNIPFSNGIFDRYTELVRPFFVGIDQIAGEIDRRDLRQGAELMDLTSRQVTVFGLLGREVGVTALLSPGGLDQRDEVANVAALLAQFVRLADQIRARSTGPYAEAGDDRLFIGLTEGMISQVDGAMHGQFDTQEFLDTMTPRREDTYQAYRERVAMILRDRAEELSDAAARRERTYLVLVTLAVTAAVVIMLLVARSITRPLTSLAQQVMHTAHHGLRQAVATVLRTPMGEDVRVPDIEPITVDTADEIAEVAAVMNTVQEAVVDLAVEQAMMRRNLADSFVSLGRRNQNLLSRQLDFVTQLQRAEVDPDALGHLFQLDHLATRMRRNAESLLVLAGIETPRKWQAPVSIVDVVRAALSEVEQYQRVRLAIMDPFTVLGNIAFDLAHLLAELIDNALLYSPPDEVVEVRGLNHPAGYSIAIIDAGVGMPPAEIAQANKRLAGAESFTVAPSKYLGHYVAGNLAIRHHIHVHLQNSPGPGTTAIVHLPLSLTPQASISATSAAGLSGSLVTDTSKGASASATALTTAGGAPMAPPSPTPL
jgi:signal transduction histidine kinase